MAATAVSSLTSGRLLARNTVWNLLGQLLPMMVGFAAIPPLVRGMGIPRFGVLSLAWTVIGYFSLFDLGMGRALTKLVAERLAHHDEQTIGPLVWTSLLMMLLLGGLGGLLTWALTPLLVQRALKVPSELQSETMFAFYLLGLSIPLITVSSGLRGVLEAQQGFRVLNVIRIPMSIFTFAGPLLVLPFSPSLVPVIGILLVGRLVGLVGYLCACFRAVPGLRRNFVLRRSLVLPVIRFGGWMTLSNIVSPVMCYLDRFLIGALVSVSVLAYYTIPFDTVNRLSVIPCSMAGVLFPAFALSVIQNPKRAGLLLSRALNYIFLTVYPVLLVTVALAPEALRLWLGPAFSEHGTVVLRWLATGVFVNSFAQAPFSLIQSAGRPDITAKLHLIELPIYLSGIWILTKHLGIEGAAIAWAGRVTLDAVLLFLVAHRILPESITLQPRLAVGVTGGLLLLYVATLPKTFEIKALLLFVGLLAFGLAGWAWFLGSAERGFLFGREQRLG